MGAIAVTTPIDRQQGFSIPAQQAADTMRKPATDGQPPPPTRSRSLGAILAAVVAGLVVGGILGASLGSSDADSARAEAARARQAAATAQKAAAASKARADSAVARATQRANDQLEVERTSLMADVQSLRDQVNSDSVALDARSAKLDARENKLDKRERAVASMERTAAANTIPGDGIYAVGSDIKPGVYKSTGNSGCYWSRLSSFDTFDIIDNGNTDGSLVIEVRSTDAALELSGCSELHKVG